jgi:hypothetical protein
MRFLATIHDVYEQLVINRHPGNDMAMEFEAFVALLQDRTITTPDGHFLFKLYACLELPLTTPPELFVEYNGSSYLRIDCLRDDDNAMLVATTNPGV